MGGEFFLRVGPAKRDIPSNAHACRAAMEWKMNRGLFFIAAMTCKRCKIPLQGLPQAVRASIPDGTAALATIQRSQWDKVMLDVQSAGRRLRRPHNYTASFNKCTERYAMVMIGDEHVHNKAFALPWGLDLFSHDAGVFNHLGGRQRGRDGTLFAIELLKILCNAFPGYFAIVLCDGVSGFDDDDGTVYYDGCGSSFKNIDYGAWPW